MGGGGGKGGSSPSGFTTTTTNASSAPWAAQQPYLTEGFARAADLLHNNQPSYFPGSTVAPVNPLISSGISGIADYASNALPAFANAGAGFTSDLLRGQYLDQDPSLGPLKTLAAGGGPLSYLTDYASGKHAAAGNPYLSGLSESVLSQVVPSIQKQFIDAGGGLGGSIAPYATAQGATAALAPLMFGQYQKEAENQLQAAGLQATGQLQGANALSGAYGNNLQRMIQGLALGPQTAQLGLAGPQALLSAGQTQQGQEQQIITDAIQRYNYGQTLPYNLLNQYLGQIAGNYGGTQTGSTSSPYYMNQGANVLSGGLGGAVLGSQLLPGLGLSSGAGAGIGGGLGLLLGLI